MISINLFWDITSARINTAGIMKRPITRFPRSGFTIQKITAQLTKIPTKIKKPWLSPIPGKVEASAYCLSKVGG